MFVGEAPGQVEDETGRPFVGRSGELLDRIIENGMECGGPTCSSPTSTSAAHRATATREPDEIAACLPWLRAQIEIIRPEVVITLGRVALNNLLGTAEPMRCMRGRDLSYQGIPVVATWHPAYFCCATRRRKRRRGTTSSAQTDCSGTQRSHRVADRPRGLLPSESHHHPGDCAASRGGRQATAAIQLETAAPTTVRRRPHTRRGLDPVVARGM
ncbi:MAG: uracil-DNA glycosylase [Planctomycetes bacterium]|nr:uracil-DNA glycosylase [Planctomycetota bacterium]